MVRNLHPDVIRALEETGVELFEVASYRGLTNSELDFALQTYDEPEEDVKMIHELAKLPSHERQYGIDEDGNSPTFVNHQPSGNIVNIIRSDMDGCENFLYLVYQSRNPLEPDKPYTSIGYGVQVPGGDGLWVNFWKDSKKAWDAFRKLYPWKKSLRKGIKGKNSHAK